MPVVLPFRQFIIKGVFIKELSQVNPAGIHLYFRCRSAKEETGRIQRIGIEIWKNRIDQFLHVSVQRSIRNAINRKHHMELGSRRFSVLLSHMETAKMDGKRHSRKSLHYVFRRFPVGGILGVIIITVDRKAIAADKVFSVAIVVLIFRHTHNHAGRLPSGKPRPARHGDGDRNSYRGSR